MLINKSKIYKKLNICFLCKTFMSCRGGAESYYFRMANALTSKGYTIHIITQEGNEKSYINNLNKSILVHAIDYKEALFRGSWRIEEIFPLSDIRYSKAVAKRLKQIQKEYPIDIIQAPDWTLEGFWLTIQKKKLFIRLHGMSNINYIYPSRKIKQNLKNKIVTKINKYIIQNSLKISTVSNYFADFVKNSFNISKPIEIIHNGIDQNFYKPADIERERSVLYVGCLEQSKGIKVIAEAIPLVLKDHPDIKFVFAGKFLKYQNTDKSWKDYLIENLPNQNLIFFGQISADKLITLYQKSLIGVFPSFFEAGGTAALESMACGCATIATKIGGLQENIEDGKDGLFIPVNNPSALADAIKKLLTDDVLRKNISLNAIQKITTKFNLDRITEQTINSYHEIVTK